MYPQLTCKHRKLLLGSGYELDPPQPLQVLPDDVQQRVISLDLLHQDHVQRGWIILEHGAGLPIVNQGWDHSSDVCQQPQNLQAPIQFQISQEFPSCQSQRGTYCLLNLRTSENTGPLEGVTKCTLSSRLSPPPAAAGPVACGSRDSMVSNSILASAIWLAMSALKCWPNSSGCSLGGNPLM